MKPSTPATSRGKGGKLAARRQPVPLSFSGALARTAAQTFCGTGSVYGIAPDLSQLIIIPIRCKSWDCPVCGPKRLTQMTAKICSGLPSKFITLTLKPYPNETLASMFDNVKAAWTKLVKRIRREFGPFEYVLTWELTKNGTPHAHVAARAGYIPQNWLSRQWRDLTGSPVVDIRAVKRPQDIARYVTKYMTKNAGQTAAALDGRRLFQFSGHYLDTAPPFKPETDYEGWTWTWTSHTLHDLLDVAPVETASYDLTITDDSIVTLTCPPGVAPPKRIRFQIEGESCTYGTPQISDRLEDAWDQLSLW